MNRKKVPSFKNFVENQWKILLLRDTSAGFFTLADMHLPLLELGLEHGQSVR